MPIDTLIDTNPGGDPHRQRASIDEYDGHNYGVLSFTDVIVKSSNVGAIKIGFKVGTERLSRYVARFGFGQPVVAGLSRREPGHRLGARASGPSSALASVSMGYQVGVTPLQMVGGGQRGRQRRRAASSRASSARSIATAARYAVHAEGRAPRDQRRHRGDADRRSWKASSSDGTGNAGADRRLHDRRQDRHGRRSSSTAATRRPTTTRRSSGSCRRATRRSRSSS